MSPRRQFGIWWTFVLAIAALLGCGDQEGGKQNHAPNVLSLTVLPEYPAPGEKTQLRYNVEDVDGDPVELRWEVTGGRIFVEDKKYWWEAADSEGTYRLKLIATDGVSTDMKTLDVLVWEPRKGNFYPIAVGNRWEYRDSKANTVTFEYIDTLKIENTNVTTFVLETKTTDPGVPEGITNYAYVGRVKDGINQHAVNVVFGSNDTLIFDPWLPLYRFPFIPGRDWKVRFKGYLPEGLFIGEGTAAYRVVDETTVTVPAGTFEHVFQIEETFQWHLIGEQLDKTVSRKWLAPNVGIIKLDQEQTRGGQTERIQTELIRYDLKPDQSFDLIPEEPGN